MKKLVLLATIFSLSIASFAQDGGKVKKADKAFESFSYDLAIEKYSEVDQTSMDVKRKQALSYWRTHNSLAAEPLFREIVTTDGHIATDIYCYAAVLRENKKYEESEEWMSKYAEMNVTDSRGKMYVKEKGSFERLLKENTSFTIKNLDINSEQQDFAAAFYKDQVVFASSREGTKSVRRRWNWNRLPFLDVYVADKNEDFSLVNPANLSGKINKNSTKARLLLTKKEIL